jgi:hypothetical protein
MGIPHKPDDPDERSPSGLPRPKRGAVPSPKSDIEEAPAYLPEDDEEDTGPSSVEETDD